MGNYEHILINGNAQKKKEPVEKTPLDGYDFHDGFFLLGKKIFLYTRPVIPCATGLITARKYGIISVRKGWCS